MYSYVGLQKSKGVALASVAAGTEVVSKTVGGGSSGGTLLPGSPGGATAPSLLGISSSVQPGSIVQRAVARSSDTRSNGGAMLNSGILSSGSPESDGVDEPSDDNARLLPGGSGSALGSVRDRAS